MSCIRTDLDKNIVEATIKQCDAPEMKVWSHYLCKLPTTPIAQARMEQDYRVQYAESITR